jgi:hypothetical protein
MKKVFVDKYTFLDKSVLEANNKKFYRFFNVCPLSYKEKFVEDANKLVKQDYVSNTVPPIQTLNQTYIEKTKGLEHWDFLYNYIKEKLFKTFNQNFKYKQSWINISTENNAYTFHSHHCDMTCIYYVKNNYPVFGTNIEHDFIIPFIENSLMFFDGRIQHSVENMPKELLSTPNNYRYTIVFDFNLE